MTEQVSSSRVVVLVATIPARFRSCERLLLELTKQSRRPDAVVLVLDGYGKQPAPVCSFPVIAEYRTDALSGAGARWRVVKDLPADDILVCLDDDVVLFEAPGLIKSLVESIESGSSAAAAMGRTVDGKMAPPGAYSRGELIHGLGCGLTVRAGVLSGLQDFAAEIIAAKGPDALGVHGDDDAIVSAFLWKTGVKIHHAATGNIYAVSGTKSTSQTVARVAKGENLDAQKVMIKKICGWPWPVAVSARRAV